MRKIGVMKEGEDEVKISLFDDSTLKCLVKLFANFESDKLGIVIDLEGFDPESNSAQLEILSHHPQLKIQGLLI